MKKNYLVLLGLSCILIVVGWSSLGLLCQKENLYIDEICSLVFSNYQITTLSDVLQQLHESNLSQYISDLIEADCTGVFSHQDMINRMIVQDGNEFSYFSLSVFLTVMDAHPPLYYYLLHTISSITHSSNIYYIGFSLNIFFLLSSCVFIYLVVKKLTFSDCLALIAVAYYGFSSEFANNVLYIRMYSMTACWFVILLYLYILLAESGWSDRKKLVRIICVVEVAAMLTHYFSAFYILPMAWVAIHFSSDNDFKKYFLKASFIAGVVWFVAWPQVIYQLYRALLLKISIDSGRMIWRIYKFCYILIDSLFAGNVLLFILFILALSFVIIKAYRRKRGVLSFEKRISWLVLIPSCGFYGLMVLIAPWVESRYVSPVMPVFSIIIILVLRDLLTRFLKNNSRCAMVSSGFILLFVLCSSIVWRKAPVSLQYLCKPSKEINEFVCKYHSLPCIIFDKDDYRFYMSVATNYPQEKYIRTDESHSWMYLPSVMKEERYVFYVSVFTSFDKIESLIIQQGFSYEKLPFSADFYDLYLLSKNY